MSRSLKKGPFVDAKLAKKIAALGSDDRTVIKTWHVLARLHQIWLVALSLFTTVASMSQSMFLKTWLVTSLVNSRQLANSANTEVKSNE